MRAWIDIAERADTQLAHAILDKILRMNPGQRAGVFDFALYERDAVAADRALAELRAQGDDTFDARGVVTQFSRDYLEGLVARMKGDAAAAQAAFTAARAQQEEAVRARPDYGAASLRPGPDRCCTWAKRRGAARRPPGTRAGTYSEGFFGWRGRPLFLCRDLCVDWRTRPGHRATRNSRENPSRSKLRRPASESDWDSLRGDPRFEKIVASLAPR